MARNTFSSRPNFRLSTNVWLISQDPATNRSKVGWQLWIERTDQYGSQSGSGTAYRNLYLNGDLVANITEAGFNFTNAGPWAIASGESQITHNDDGTKTFHIEANASYAILGSTTVHDDMVLPTIARKSVASFSGGSTITAGTAVTINTNRAASGYTHDLQVFFGGVSTTIATGVGSSQSWTPPMSLLEEIPKATSGPGTLRTLTFSNNGSSYLGYTDTPFTLRAASAVVPTIPTIAAVDDNSTVSDLVGRYVQGLSVLKVTVNAEGVYGSTITGSDFTIDGITAPSGGAIPLSASGSRPVTAKATDSRGRVGTFSSSIDVLPYAPPVVTLAAVNRATAAGVVNNDGTSLRIDLTATASSLLNGTQRNTLGIRVFTRPRGTTQWTARNVINHSSLSYASNFLVSGGANYPISQSFDVRVEVFDKFSTIAAQSIITTSAVYWHWAAGGVGVGKFWEQGALDVNGDIYSSGSKVLAVRDFATNAEAQAATSTAKAMTPAAAKAREVVRTLSWTARKGSSSALTANTMTNVLSITLPASAPAGRYIVQAQSKTYCGSQATHYKRVRWGSTELDGTAEGTLAPAGDVFTPGMWQVDHAGGGVIVYLDSQVNAGGAFSGDASRLQIIYLGPTS